MTISIVLLAFTAYHDYKEALIEKGRRRGSGREAGYNVDDQDTDGQSNMDTQYYQQICSFESASESFGSNYPNPDEHEHENIGNSAQNGSSWMSALSNPFSVAAYSSQPHASNRPSNTAEIGFISRMSTSGTDSQSQPLSDYAHHFQGRHSGD